MASDQLSAISRQLTRRDFLMFAGVAAASGMAAAAQLAGRGWWEAAPESARGVNQPQPPGRWATEALYATSFAQEGSLNCAACHSKSEDKLPVSYCHIPHGGNYVRCGLCPHHCIIADGERGRCRVRENRGGRLYSMVYGNPCAVHIDPIEKKPFFHFLPTAAAYSLATTGCPLRCLYCQNWSISQAMPEETQNNDLPPEAVVQGALDGGAPVIAYTYSEPVAFYEYMLESARQARQAGLKNVVVSAGFIEIEPLRQLCSVVEAIKIDLKGFDEKFYQEVCQARLAPVLQAIRTIYESGIHLEIVNLVVPTLNDDLEQLHSLARWLAQEISPDVPLHFSRFFPQYKLDNLPPTPLETLDKAYQVARQAGLRFVYVGNVPGHAGNNTYCPRCNLPIIIREGFAVLEYHLRGNNCEYCGEPIAGVFWEGKPPGFSG